MNLRSIWKGHLKISLVQIPVRVYTRISTAESIQFNQLHRDCHQRVRQKLCCPVHGDINREQIIKGYEFEKDKYVVVEEADFQKIRLETTQTIEIVQFSRPEELDPVYLDVPYFLGPESRVGLDAYCIVQEAIRRAGLIGIGRVVLNGREKPVALQPAGNGLMFTTLRSAGEVRAPESLFDSLIAPKLDAEQLQLAQQLIAQKTSLLDQTQFKDRYQDGLLELIKAKVAGTVPTIAPADPAQNVVNLMDALRQSLATAPKTKKHRLSRAKIAA